MKTLDPGSAAACSAWASSAVDTRPSAFTCPPCGRFHPLCPVAIADSDPERLRLVGDRFAIQRRYLDPEVLLRDTEIDAVAVCVPPRAHAEIALAVLDAGRHLLVEKPLCLDLDDADRLVERAGARPWRRWWDSTCASIVMCARPGAPSRRADWLRPRSRSHDLERRASRANRRSRSGAVGGTSAAGS